MKNDCWLLRRRDFHYTTIMVLLVVMFLAGCTLGSLLRPRAGNCVDWSYTLAPVLYQFGLPVEIVYGSRIGGSHCWVQVLGIPLELGTWRYRVDFVDRYPWGYWDELGIEGVL